MFCAITFVEVLQGSDTFFIKTQRHTRKRGLRTKEEETFIFEKPQEDLDSKGDPITDQLKELPITEEPKDNPITDNLKEDPITEDTKEGLIIGKPNKNLVTADPKEIPITKDAKENTATIRPLRSFRTLDNYSEAHTQKNFLDFQ